MSGSYLLRHGRSSSSYGRVPMSDEFDEFDDQDQDSGELDFDHQEYDDFTREPESEGWMYDDDIDADDFDDSDYDDTFDVGYDVP